MESKEFTVTLKIKAVGIHKEHTNLLSAEDLKEAVKTFFKLHNGDVQDIEVNGIRLLIDDKHLKIK